MKSESFTGQLQQFGGEKTMPQPRLRLVEDGEDSNVVPLPVREASTFDLAWSARQGMMKKRGFGIDRTKKLWDATAKKVGSARLLAALKAYCGQKEPTWGFAGLSVWLNAGSYDHWLCETENGDANPERERFPEPYRTDALKHLDEAFVRSYLDPCTFHDDGYITPATGFASKKLMEKAGELKAAGVAGIRRRE